MTTFIPAKNSIDMTGQRINFLTVLHSVKKHPRFLHWKCRCDCGKEIEVLASLLRREKKLKSCGCQKARILRERMWEGYEEISRSYWSRLERGARDRGFEFKISIEEAWKLFLKQNRKCGLTGLLLTFTTCVKRKKEEQTASLDRIDSSKGYTLDNIMWIHKEINVLKMDNSNKEFIRLCKLVATHNA